MFYSLRMYMQDQNKIGILRLWYIHAPDRGLFFKLLILRLEFTNSLVCANIVSPSAFYDEGFSQNFVLAKRAFFLCALNQTCITIWTSNSKAFFFYFQKFMRHYTNNLLQKDLIWFDINWYLPPWRKFFFLICSHDALFSFLDRWMNSSFLWWAH